jgi:molecular chaperone DnaJ
LASTLSDQTKTISVQTTNGDRFTVEVNVPRGVTNGTSIKYSGLGDNFFNTLPRGDLYVEFRIIPHQHINVNGIDLVTAVHIDSLKAIVGGEVTVKGLDGTEFVVAIPKGCQYGTKLRIKGQGLWQVNQPIRGNLIVMVNIVTPTNLSEDQLQDILKISENLSS